MTRPYLTLIFCLFILSIYGQQTALEIVNESYRVEKYLADDGLAKADMQIKNADGKTTMERSLVILRKNAEGLNQKWYAYFKSPADIRRMVFMAWKNPGADDDRWLYLPALDLVKRLSGSDKRGSFVGSNFVYEDITGRYPALDKHSITSEDDKAYLITSMPIKSDVEFSKYETTIDKSNFVVMERLYFNKQGKPSRKYTADKVESIQGFPTVTKFTMTDMESGESTVTSFSEIKYNVGLPDNVFSEASLRRSPRKWVR